ncbi:hypothetical protein FOS14_09875 [Skermania sp. ID1734]|uniref:hypothetical protein n=1 Tax=Skermania sp. ID1734 TaxID=2597516 RepID=UPI00117F002A|nr:hypothetical protein [Skermania sp. ID1734]TSE00109.1 hypothetical protein FOS14_09875 [Skermania sp. ID1734]
MATEFISIDRSKLSALHDADPMNFLGDITAPAQACRAVFIAAQVGALTWDKQAWPELTFGVWSDGSARAESTGRRRAQTETRTELSPWLQLRPSWPQLGGPGIAWPVVERPPGATGAQIRARDIIEATAEALNSIYAQAQQMARALLGEQQAQAPLVPRPKPVSVRQPPSGPRTFTAARVANSIDEVTSVLAELSHDAELDAGVHQGLGVVTNLCHAITALPENQVNGNRGHGARFLVTVSATIDKRPAPR